MLSWLLGCVMPGPFEGPRGSQPQVGVPELANLLVDCDAEASSWTVTAEATAWTGGATTWWTIDGDYVEEHPIQGLAFEPDGTGESLGATIPIVTDWRLATAKDTVFTCAEDPNVLFVLFDLDGARVDCRSPGPEPEIWDQVEGVTGCDR